MFKHFGKKTFLIACIIVASFSRITYSSNPIPSPEWVGVFDVQGKAGLVWIKSPGVMVYKVYRRRIDESKFALIEKTSENRYVDDDIQPRISYLYRLVGVTSEGEESSPSSEIQFTLRPKAKEAIQAPSWEGYLISKNGIGLKWTSSNPQLVIAYNIYRKELPDGQEALIASRRENTFSDYYVESSHKYQYRISALDSNFHESSYSEPIVVDFFPRDDEKADKKPSYSLTSKRSYLVRSFHGGGGKSTPFFSPTDVALSPQGLLFIADSGNGLIQVFSKEGSFRYDFPVPPVDRDTRSNPLGLTVDKDGRIYCTDAYSGRILVFKARGSLIQVIDIPLEENENSFGLLDVCLDEQGDIFVVDNGNHKMALFSPDLTFFKFFGEPGLDPGKFAGPAFCAADPEGRLLITDSLGGRLQIFNNNGEYIKSFGMYGKNVGGFARPKGVALDSKGRIFIADSWLCQIQAFDESGEYLFTLVDEKDDPIDLGSPNGIFIDNENNIYIAERLAHRIQIRHIQDD